MDPGAAARGSGRRAGGRPCPARREGERRGGSCRSRGPCARLLLLTRQGRPERPEPLFHGRARGKRPRAESRAGAAIRTAAPPSQDGPWIAKSAPSLIPSRWGSRPGSPQAGDLRRGRALRRRSNMMDHLHAVLVAHAPRAGHKSTRIRGTFPHATATYPQTPTIVDKLVKIPGGGARRSLAGRPRSAAHRPWRGAPPGW